MLGRFGQDARYGKPSALVLAISLGVVMCLSIASPGLAGERIAFARYAIGTDHEIYTIKPDGTSRKRLTRNEKGDLEPTFSPDRKLIAYQCSGPVGEQNQQRHGDICVVRTDGSHQRKVISSRAAEKSPTWSPDGRWIAYVKIRSRPSGFQWDIYRVKVSSGRQVKVTDDTFVDDHPTWSPDGRRIAFTSERGGARDIYSIRPDGTGLKNISSSPEAEMTPDWAPDGSKLVFGRYLEAAVGTEGWQIFVARKDGSRSRQLTENATASNFSPAWAPGGQRIVFTREDDLFVMNKKGGRERRLTGSGETSNFYETTPDW